jgi:hypothetical protein
MVALGPQQAPYFGSQQVDPHSMLGTLPMQQPAP